MHRAPSILVISHLYPSTANPYLGLFVARQVRALRETHDVRVVAPTRWLPPVTRSWKRERALPTSEVVHDTPVYRPRALHFPFGMTTAEAQAAGRPPIAFANGGALEIVRDGVTGFLVPDQTPEAFTVAMRRALEQPLDAGDLVASAKRFDAALFDAAIRDVVAEASGAARPDHPAATATAAAA